MNNKGYIALISTIIIGAVGLTMISSLLLISTDTTLTNQTLFQSNQAKSFANTCTEIALEHIRTDQYYTGSENIIIENGNCNFTITNLGGNKREILSTGIIKNVIRKSRTTINAINPTIKIDIYQEINDF